MAAPRTTACAPWITGDAVLALPRVQQAIYQLSQLGSVNGVTSLTDDDYAAYAATAATHATDLLYRMSGRQYAGECGPVTVRPVARPVDADSRGWVNRNWSYGGWGSASVMLMGQPSVMSQYGEAYPPIITLYDFPVREILLVKIDGVVIPPAEYELREFQQLVRIRPTTSATPTERWGWPTSQIEDLPDDQFGTFSVTYLYGADPGTDGREAALKMAEVLLLPKLGDNSATPARLTNISRQGVNFQVESAVDALKLGGTGVYEVDLWLKTVNPTQLARQTVIWSPDRAPNRRQGRPTLS